MVTVHYFIQDIDAEGVQGVSPEQHKTFSDPLEAARMMSDVELYDNLTPCGWNWDTEAEYRLVLAIRKGRDYKDELYKHLGNG